jgi:hypothetical protein
LARGGFEVGVYDLNRPAAEVTSAPRSTIAASSGNSFVHEAESQVILNGS